MQSINSPLHPEVSEEGPTANIEAPVELGVTVDGDREEENANTSITTGIQEGGASVVARLVSSDEIPVSPDEIEAEPIQRDCMKDTSSFLEGATIFFSNFFLSALMETIGELIRKKEISSKNSTLIASAILSVPAAIVLMVRFAVDGERQQRASSPSWLIQAKDFFYSCICGVVLPPIFSVCGGGRAMFGIYF